MCGPHRQIVRCGESGRDGFAFMTLELRPVGRGLLGQAPQVASFLAGCARRAISLSRCLTIWSAQMVASEWSRESRSMAPARAKPRLDITASAGSIPTATLAADCREIGILFVDEAVRVAQRFWTQFGASPADEGTGGRRRAGSPHPEDTALSRRPLYRSGRPEMGRHGRRLRTARRPAPTSPSSTLLSSISAAAAPRATPSWSKDRRRSAAARPAAPSA